MNTRRLIPILTLSGLLLSGVVAQAQTILPVDPNTGLPIASTVTVTLSTTNWLPTPASVNATAAAVTITVKKNNSPVAATLSLVCPDGTLANGSPCPDAPGPGFIPAPGQVRTSAYPGVCTNFPSNVNPALPVAVDFTLSGNTLTSLDCGGTAVILVDSVPGSQPLTFVIPQDSDFDLIPDIWEAKFCPSTASNKNILCPPDGNGSLVASADPDNDGFSNFDEYRGVTLSESSFLHMRLHSNEPDLFVSFINPGCDVAATESRLGGGTTTYIAGTNPNDGRAIFANLNSLRPATATDPLGPRVHPVGYPAGAPATHQEVTTGEGIDDYRSCSYDAATSQLVFSPALGDLDRLITANALYLVSESPQTTLTPGAPSGSIATFTAGTSVFNSFHVGSQIIATVAAAGATPGRATITAFQSQTAVTANITQAFTFPPSPHSQTAFAAGEWRLSQADQKWLRCVESDDTSSTTVFATGGYSTANVPVSCTVYTKRIENRLKAPTTGLIDQGGTRKIRVQTFNGSSWVTLFEEGPGMSRDEAIRRLVAEVIRFYTTMEFTHMGKVRATLGACGAHDCAGTGHLVDKDFVQIIDNKTTGFNTFRVPTQANSTIRSEFKHRVP